MNDVRGKIGVTPEGALLLPHPTRLIRRPAIILMRVAGLANRAEMMAALWLRDRTRDNRCTEYLMSISKKAHG